MQNFWCSSPLNKNKYISVKYMFMHVLVLGIARIKKYLDTHPTLYISIYEPGSKIQFI